MLDTLEADISDVASRIVWAWIVTLPAAGLMGAAFYGLARLVDRIVS
jgi:inorganic phosphate transporter, PiT family